MTVHSDVNGDNIEDIVRQRHLREQRVLVEEGRRREFRRVGRARALPSQEVVDSLLRLMMKPTSENNRSSSAGAGGSSRIP